MKKIIKYTFTIGLLLIVLGFICHIMFAGIPQQDPPLDLQIKFDRNATIATWIMNSGGIASLIGAIFWIAHRWRQLSKKD